ncbi:hypothetical protein A2U01_0050894, partial [Trifolium medium]|nr:hypothetical protein [Trifolium medium]
MTELYSDDLTAGHVGSKDAIPVIETTSEGVETPVKVSETLGQNISNDENLGVFNPQLSDNLGKNLNSGSSTVEPIVDGSTKGSGVCVDETLKGTVPEISVVPDVGTSVAPEIVTSETIHDNAVEEIVTEKEKTPVVEKS